MHYVSRTLKERKRRTFLYYYAYVKSNEVAMTAVSATRFRAGLYKYLDDVITTGQSVEVVLRGRRVRVVAVDAPTRLAAMEPRADYIVGDPDDLVRPTFDEEAWRKASDQTLKKRRHR